VLGDGSECDISFRGDRSNNAVALSSSSSSCSSESDSDSDALMVSQELQPGFCAADRDVNHGGVFCTDSAATQPSVDRRVDFPVDANSTQTGSAADGTMPDISEYLREIPLDWLSDAANLLNHTLQFNCLSPNLLSSDASGMDDGEVSAIVRGAKQVRVPPGKPCVNVAY